MKNNFPRLIIAATQSGCGKTTITAGLLGALKNRGLRVQPYKVGPDYIDTGWHALSCGRTSHNLDSWLMGTDNIRKIFTDTASDADVSVVEGVMGLYDGGRDGISSTAEISKLLDAPVVLVIDAKSMGTSAAAIALGFREFDPSVKLAGVILNRLGSASHERLIVDALNKVGIKVFGALHRNDEFVLPERHLGLVPTTENFAVDAIKKISAAVKSQVDVDALIEVARNTVPLESFIHDKKISPVVKIAVARDAAFNFYYDASLTVLEQLGAQIVFFSPLADETLPADIDGLIIGGGFPELFADKLERNQKIRHEINHAVEMGLPVFAECGGFMFLMNRLVDFDGRSFEMCGVFDGTATMTNRLQRVGYVTARAGDLTFHAHEFRYSVADVEEDLFSCRRLRDGSVFTAGVRKFNAVGSYLHTHFAGCPELARAFVAECLKRQ